MALTSPPTGPPADGPAAGTGAAAPAADPPARPPAPVPADARSASAASSCSDVPPAATAPAGGGPVRRRPHGRADLIASVVFGTWITTGLFVDGWSHGRGKPETFFTPWHALLYSGFAAGVAWFTLTDARRRRRGEVVATDPQVVVGAALFLAGGVADMIWHLLFGIEVGVEALLSPSHLVLMFAGLLLVTALVRAEGPRPAPGPGPDPAAATPASWSELGAAVAGLTLAVAVISFFTQWVSALVVFDRGMYTGDAGDGFRLYGVVSVLVTNAVLVGATLWTVTRWPRPPAGTFTLLFGATAVAMAGLDGFDHGALIGPVLLAGAVADLLVAGRVGELVLATVLPVVLWGGWFLTYHAAWTLSWPAELIGGSIVFAALSGYGLALLATGGLHRPAPDRS